MHKTRQIKFIVVFSIILVGVIVIVAYTIWCRPTKILIVNPLPAQAAEISLNNVSKHIKVISVPMEEAYDFEKFDAIVMYGRGLFLDSLQLKSFDNAIKKGIPVFINSLKNLSFIENHNLDSLQIKTLQKYFFNPNAHNYKNLLRYLRHIANPNLIGDQNYEEPIELPSEMFYHLRAGKYFQTAEELKEYLMKEGLYIPNGKNVVFISGTTFPVENNRAHVDTLISRLLQSGFNVFPLSASGMKRTQMIKEVEPDAVVYLPMGRLGNDSLINWLYKCNIPLFMPYPLIQSHEEWLDINNPISGGTLNARIVIPEIDGAMGQLSVSTQNANDEGYLLYTPEPERINAFMQQFNRFMELKEKNNRDKKIAIGYFKSPGKDALLASGMEVVPSLYNFLNRLKKEGYNVSGLPSTLDQFKKELMTQGRVIGDYALTAQERFMNQSHPIWINKEKYLSWAHEILLPDKFSQVEETYGPAPGSLLSRNDSLAIAGLIYGNILLFPQPRPALGDDDYKLVHGMEIVPPHSYIGPYLYIQKEFDADAIIHFGTHGNLEFTPGKNAALSQADWAEVLIGNRPHFYFYTTANIGEAIIAKRRSHAVLVTHLTPPYIESELSNNYKDILEEIHSILNKPEKNYNSLKKRIIDIGIHKDIDIDSLPAGLYSIDDLKKIDSYLEELVNEKVTGAYYVMGVPYSQDLLNNSVMAIYADRLAFSNAKKDFEKGKINQESLHDFSFISHNYLPKAKEYIQAVLNKGGNHQTEIDTQIELYKNLLIQSAGEEINRMISALNGMPVPPAPGGDPVSNPNVLPMGRNMYSINAESTPGKKAWDDGVRLASETLKTYYARHGKYPQKVSYIFWAGEFISSEGATIAQALWMLGVEPVWDEQGRMMDLKLIPSELLGRPRINILVQVSGQLRDIAASRLKMITDAVKLAASSKEDIYPNFVAEGSLEQEKQLVKKGEAPQRARELSDMRVFGPVNSGYSTGMLQYTENSGEWEKESEIADGYLNNMCALYGDEDNWGVMNKDLLSSAIKDTEVIVQPRQSNTWGPVSLDHVYEFTGALSLASREINGKEPEAMMADYRNPSLPRMQETKDAIAIEIRASLLNPSFIKERMKGEAGSAQTFGEMFRNIFGWSVTRKSALPKDLYQDLYKVYIEDINGLGIKDYFEKVNPAAYQELTATMLESARKGYWNPTEKQLKEIADYHANTTEKFGVPCTEFVCKNKKLQEFILNQLSTENGKGYAEELNKALTSNSDSQILKKEKLNSSSAVITSSEEMVKTMGIILGIILVFGLLYFFINSKKRYK